MRIQNYNIESGFKPNMLTISPPFCQVSSVMKT